MTNSAQLTPAWTDFVDQAPGLVGPPSKAAATRPASKVVRIVLPAYNESESLGRLLQGIAAAFGDTMLAYQVIVVDDGSVDKTADIAGRAAEQMPVRLIRHPANQGLAAALRTGLRAAISEAADDDVIVVMDADNTHPPALILRLVQGIREGFDVVIASRFVSGARVVGVPYRRHLLSLAARCLFGILFPIRGVRDYTSGYRAYRAKAICAALAQLGDTFVSEKGFSCMVDILLKLRRQPLVFGEVPLVLRYDQKAGASKMRVLQTIWDTLRLMARRRLGAVT